MTKTLVKNEAVSEFERLLNESFSYSFKAADLVKGTIVKIDNKEILVDIGAKSEAVLPLREVSKTDLEGDSALKIGDEREFLILKEEDEDGVITLSLKRVSLLSIFTIVPFTRSAALNEYEKDSFKSLSNSLTTSFLTKVLVILYFSFQFYCVYHIVYYVFRRRSASCNTNTFCANNILLKFIYFIF